VRPLQSLLRAGDVWLGRMGHDPAFQHSIPNALMASRPLQEFWLVVIDMLLDHARALRDGALVAGPPTVTGPILLKKAYDHYMNAPRSTVRETVVRMASRLPADLQPDDGPSQVTMLEPSQWYALDWSNPIHLRLCREVVESGLSTPTARLLFPEACLVTYWTHSW